MMDYYHILGVERESSPDEIKRAYRNLAKKYHPDGVAEGEKEAAAARFNECAAAYEVLSDPAKKANYDRNGNNDAVFPPDLGDIFGFNPWRNGRHATKGAPLTHSVTVTLQETLYEVSKDITFDRIESCVECSGRGMPHGKDSHRCKPCGGRGKVVNSHRQGPVVYREERLCQVCGGEGKIIAEADRCKKCLGKGQVTLPYTITIKVPPGVLEGMTMRITSQGHLGSYGGPRGDVFINIHVTAHADFQRINEHGDLVYEMPISIAQALIGDKVTITAIDGDSLEVGIPEYCKNDSTMTFNGRGLPRLNAVGRGVLLVRFGISVPLSITNEQRELIEQFDAIEKGKNVQKSNQDNKEGCSAESNSQGSGTASLHGISGFAASANG